jgi:5-methylcytosine-specific restriction endonuclease McrA
VNSWNIPDWLESEVKNRDRNCVYCRVEFGSSNATKKSIATWEHIVNDARIVTRENIARCCFSCNSSKGTKTLADWLESDYCKKRGITKETVAEVVRTALVYRPNIPNGGA